MSLKWRRRNSVFDAETFLAARAQLAACLGQLPPDELKRLRRLANGERGSNSLGTDIPCPRVADAPELLRALKAADSTIVPVEEPCAICGTPIWAPPADLVPIPGRHVCCACAVGDTQESHTKVA